MNRKQLKLFSRLSLGCCVVIWAVLYLYQNFSVFSLPSLKAILSGLSLTGLLWAGYFRWAWRWPYFKKILYKPNINGTWLGHFESDWGGKPQSGKFVLVIRQNWFEVSIRAFSQSLKTNSHIESFIFDEGKGLKILAYLFAEKEIGVKGDTRQGAAELELAEGMEFKILEGDFWTISGSKGFVKVKLISEKEKVDSFDVAMTNWREEESWQQIGSSTIG